MWGNIHKSLKMEKGCVSSLPLDRPHEKTHSRDITQYQYTQVPYSNIVLFDSDYRHLNYNIYIINLTGGLLAIISSVLANESSNCSAVPCILFLRPLANRKHGRGESVVSVEDSWS